MLGMPWLAGVITSAFTGLFVWFTQFLTKRLALVVAAIAIILAMTAAFFLAIEGLISALSLAAPIEVTQFAGFVLPNNISSSIAIIISARLLRYAYDWNVKFTQLKLF